MASARDTYRHGNLRAEAIAAARALVDESGHEALSLRDVARKVGVAHRSLYNHFDAREALLDAVAEDGFRDLAAALRQAVDAAGYVRAYVGFALANRRLYDLMRSRPHATMKHKAALQRAVHLGIDEARRHFTTPAMTSMQARRAIMKVLILLHGALGMHAAGILDVDGDEGLIAELQAMLAEPAN
jgi:AcrR family transcriptional regulator